MTLDTLASDELSWCFTLFLKTQFLCLSLIFNKFAINKLNFDKMALGNLPFDELSWHHPNKQELFSTLLIIQINFHQIYCPLTIEWDGGGVFQEWFELLLSL
jgi:hypothetical protein